MEEDFGGHAKETRSYPENSGMFHTHAYYGLDLRCSQLLYKVEQFTGSKTWCKEVRPLRVGL